MNRYSILGIKVSYGGYEYFVDKIIASAKKNSLLKVAPIASHPLKHAFFDPKLKRALSGFDLVLPDGQSLIWAARTIYKADIKSRIYGPELFLKVCGKCQENKMKVILFGNHTPKLKKKIQKTFPRLTITDLPDLKGKVIGNQDIRKLEQKLRKVKHAVMFIGIGSPAQHYLMDALGKVNFPVIAVGAAFDFLSGVKNQAPDWIQNMKLEWLYRLMNEPTRLWKRYLVDAPVFVLLAVLQKFGYIGAPTVRNKIY